MDPDREASVGRGGREERGRKCPSGVRKHEDWQSLRVTSTAGGEKGGGEASCVLERRGEKPTDRKREGKGKEARCPK